MKNHILTISLLILTACAQQQEKSSALIPIEERNAPVEKPVKPVTAEKEMKADNSVIIALISDAETHKSSGNTQNAIAILERGLRIEPSNATLWHKMADVRLQQQQWQQAISLAKKSNALTNDEKLKSANWGIIAEAYQSLGELEKAKQARQKQKLTS